MIYLRAERINLDGSRRALLVASTLALLACNRKPLPVTEGPCSTTALCAGLPIASAVTSAQARLNPFKQELLAKLEAGMKQGGPSHAMDVCGEGAKPIAAAHSREGVVLGRTAHKLRNPENAPKPWMDAPMKELLVPITKQDDTKPESHYRVVALPGNRIGYIERLFMRPTCLPCHGPSISEDVKKAIASRYPGDQAVGFEKNTVRGFAWVEMPGGR